MGAMSTNVGVIPPVSLPSQEAHPGLRLRRKAARDGAPPHPPVGGRPCAGRDPIKEVVFSLSLCWSGIVRANRASLHRRPGSLNGCPPGQGRVPPIYRRAPPASVDATRPPGAPREAALAGVEAPHPVAAALNRAEEL
jgi:hypothetical protein